MKKKEVLKLNQHFYPIGVSNWKDVMVDIVSGIAFPVDVSYEMIDENTVNPHKIEYFNIVRNFDEWTNLPIRKFDDVVKTTKSIIRVPPIIVCSRFDKVVFKKVVFPTKSNVWKRDNFICQYSGKKLSRDDLSIDHVMPSSRGGENSWENLVTCDKNLNIWKGDRTPYECGLKLMNRPVKPKNGMVFSFMREEWKMFVDGGKFEVVENS